MRGTDNTTGKELSGLAHVKQSIIDILTTPIGSRPYRRDYGSRIFELLDRATNPAGLAELNMASAEAIIKWEPRFKLERVTASVAEPGKTEITIEGVYLPNGEQVEFGTIVK